MKKNNYKILSILVVFAIVIIGVVLFQACKNDKDVNDFENLPVLSSNPYDEYGGSVKTVVKEVFQIINDNPNIEYDKYMSLASDIISSAKNEYPVITEEQLVGIDSVLMSRIIKDFISNLREYGVETAVNVSLQQISRIQNSNHRDVLLNVTSQYKYTYIGILESLNNSKSWFGDWDDCMYNYADDLFNHGTWVAQSLWMLGLPISCIEWAADCAWQATANQWNDD
ncbi:MAG: hypothetical protein MJZ56_05110 [Bacteroidales bacterium]|nr:hypothetical protein [Bacteroidales bacterium]